MVNIIKKITKFLGYPKIAKNMKYFYPISSGAVLFKFLQNNFYIVTQYIYISWINDNHKMPVELRTRFINQSYGTHTNWHWITSMIEEFPKGGAAMGAAGLLPIQSIEGLVEEESYCTEDEDICGRLY